MNRQRTLLTEFTKDPKAIKEHRAEPVPVPEMDRSLAFLRAIVLDLPIQTGGTVEVQQIATETEQTVTEDQQVMLKRLAGLK